MGLERCLGAVGLGYQTLGRAAKAWIAS